MKFAILVLAGQQELARALHGLLYALELHESGHDVKLVFDGAGTTWVQVFGNPEHKYHDVFRAVTDKGLIGSVCQYCAGVFGVRPAVEAAGLPISGDAGGHPSVAKLVAEGYTLLTV